MIWMACKKFLQEVNRFTGAMMIRRRGWGDRGKGSTYRPILQMLRVHINVITFDVHQAFVQVRHESLLQFTKGEAVGITITIIIVVSIMMRRASNDVGDGNVAILGECIEEEMIAAAIGIGTGIGGGCKVGVGDPLRSLDRCACGRRCQGCTAADQEKECCLIEQHDG